MHVIISERKLNSIKITGAREEEKLIVEIFFLLFILTVLEKEQRKRTSEQAKAVIKLQNRYLKKKSKRFQLNNRRTCLVFK